jgi:hypothetical protein
MGRRGLATPVRRATALTAPGNDDRFASRDPVDEFAQAGLGVGQIDRVHVTLPTIWMVIYRARPGIPMFLGLAVDVIPKDVLFLFSYTRGASHVLTSRDRTRLL